ncbi:MAG TPA: hypothetical protein VFQ88_07305 [Nevskiaceae bacterium]|nr:hypothetical protein [Nevskiaceae bacterium]
MHNTKHITIKIETGNAAFDPEPEEVARILRELADKVEKSRGVEKGDEMSLFDANGNKVGTWRVGAR